MMCPAPEDLSRAFSEGEPNVAEHVETCDRCRSEWDGMERLRRLARALPSPPMDPAAASGVRARLLSAVVNDSRRATRIRTTVWAGVAIAAAVTLALGVRGRNARDAAVALAYHGTVTAFPGARFVRESALPTEVIRLEAGAIHVEVTPLHSGERFVVRAGDGEVEVRGTAFDVGVTEGHLASVQVLHGRVEVRNSGAAPVILGAGDAWQPAATPRPAPLGSTEAPDLGPSAPANVTDLPPSVATSARASISKSMNAVPAPSPSGSVSPPPPSRSPGAAPDTAPPPPPTAATNSLPGAATTPPGPVPFVPSPPAPSAEPSRERRDHQEERRERRDERRERLDQRRLR